MVSVSATTPRNEVYDMVIIGGGLSGVALAHEIQKSLPVYSWNLLEARPTLGGRLVNDKKGNRIDLGGAWIWPASQPKIKKLVNSLGLSTFMQPDDPSSTRIDGGAVAIVENLAKKLPAANIRLNTPVTKCTLQPGSNSTTIRLDIASGHVLAKRVVVAVPPKLVDKHIVFDPPLSRAKKTAMSASHTWMAGVTKVSLVYENKFWNEEISNMGLPQHLPGPAFQVYDASTKDRSINAMTFFCLVPPGSPAKRDNAVLADQVTAQISSVWKLYTGSDFREEVRKYKDVHVQHWPAERYISEDSEPKQIHSHPNPVGVLSTTEWDDRLYFAGSETDRQSPGVMEGAVGAALRVAQELKAKK